MGKDKNKTFSTKAQLHNDSEGTPIKKITNGLDADNKQHKERKRKKSRKKSIYEEEIVVKQKVTTKQWMVFVISMLANMLTAMIYSLQAPFYPGEAAEKGCTPSEYGFVFGIYELVVFASSPIFGKYMNQIGPKFGVIAGIFVSAASCVIFGFIDRIEGHDAFLIISIASRVLQGLGQSVYFIGISTIVASYFPDRVAFTISALETMYGLGLILGPALGGILYAIDGFYLPFVTVGGILILAGVFTVFIDYSDDSDGETGHAQGFGRMLKLPGVWLGVVAVFTTSTSSGYLQATLQPYLVPFDLKPIYLGLMFVISGGVYAVFAPFWGWLCDKGIAPRFCIAVGSLTKFTGFMLLGPLQMVTGISPAPLHIIIIGLACSGLGSGGELIPGFSETLRVSFAHGLPNSPEIYGMATSLWQSAYSIGAFVGPSCGGVMYQYLGFENGTLFPVGLNIFLVSMVVISCLFCKDPSKDQQEETVPILVTPQGKTIYISSILNNRYSKQIVKECSK